MARTDSITSPSKIALGKTGFLLIKNLSNLQEKWITDNVMIEIVNEKLNLIQIFCLGHYNIITRETVNTVEKNYIWVGKERRREVNIYGSTHESVV